MKVTSSSRLARLGLVFVAASLVALAGACASDGDAPARKAPRSKTTRNTTVIEGLEVVDSVKRGRLFIRPDHHIGSYDGFVIEPVRMGYKRGQTQLNYEAAKAIAQRLRDQLAESIVEGGLDLGREPHECLLSMQIEILDLELLDVGTSSGGAATRFLDWSGGAVLVFEFRDSMSGQTLMRYGQRRRLPGGKVTTVGGLSSAGLLQRLGEGLVDMGAAVRQVLPTTTKFREGTSCIGKIGQQSGYDASGRPSPGAPPPGQQRQ